MKTEDTEALTRQRAKPSKIKAQYSRPTCKNYSVCTIIILHNTVTQRQFFSVLPFLQTNITSQMWPSGDKRVAGFFETRTVLCMLSRMAA